MIKKVLIANRGEIALRIIRACRELQIKTLAIYSKEDKNQIHVKYADEAVCIGKAKSSDSYLNINAIITVAKAKSCDAIHPGYGFLSENYDFAKACEDENIKFIGPSSKVIALMGDKISARKLMQENNVNVIEGSEGQVHNIEEAMEIAKKIGLPILLKASNGGGGKGIRKVTSFEELERNFLEAQQESKNAFSSEKIYIEKFIENPRHIEVQILADSHKNVISLFERNCSIQKRNQKLIEEAPAINIPQAVKEDLYKQAIKAAKACNYENAGTIEFVMDKDNKFYFIEMNTRLQVEHPVTEMITGIDIVKEQLKIASGLSLSYKQEDIKCNGYAIECRINAESPLENFISQSGKVNFLFAPGGFNTRFDSYLFSGANVSPYYDSMVGKIIVFDKTRINAIRKLRRAIEETIIEGVKTNIYFSYAISFDKDFIRGNYDTSFINKKQDNLLEIMKGYI